MSKIFFVVEKRHGRETPVLYHDELPSWITSKHAAEHIAYALRLDTLENAPFYLGLNLNALYHHYLRMKEMGKLLPSNIGSKP